MIQTVYPFELSFSGLGAALVFSPTLVMLGQYFEKRYIFANSVAFCGYSFAQMIIPRLAQFLIEVGSVLCWKHSDLIGVSVRISSEIKGLHVALPNSPNGSLHDGQFEFEQSRVLWKL